MTKIKKKPARVKYSSIQISFRRNY